MRADLRIGMAVAGAMLFLTACAGDTGVSGPGAGSQPARPAAPKTLTLAFPGEPGSVINPMSSVPIGNLSTPGLVLAVHQRLVINDDRGDLLPQLARELPSRSAGTWAVNADGTMQTTYLLRPGVTWHDGTPLTAKDFVFAWRVMTDQDLPIGMRGLAPQISRIDTPNDLTIVLHWATTSPFANAITEDDIGPLPAHILEGVWPDKDRFMQSSYWTREFVGVGPYRIVEWETGSHVTLRAYDRFYGGRAKIDTIVARFILDESVAIANLLAGTVDGTATVDFASSLVVKDGWERAGQRPTVIFQSAFFRLMEVQLRPELARPRDLLDPRTRRALLHAMDRDLFVNTLLGGHAFAADSFIPPDDVKWDWVKDVATRYEYDPRRTQSLLGELGWRRGADGIYTDAVGDRPLLTLTTRPGRQSEQEIAIIADNWKAAGLPVDQVVLSAGDARDPKTISTYASFATTSNPPRFRNTMDLVYGPLCSSETNNWVGRNHGCYLNPAWDRTVDGLLVAIDPAEQRRLWRDLVQTYVEDLPVLPLFFDVRTTIFREGIVGVKGVSKPTGGLMFNAAEWEIR